MHVTYAGPYGRLDVDELAGQRASRRARGRAPRPADHAATACREELREFAIAPADAVAPTRAVLSALLADDELSRRRDRPNGGRGARSPPTLSNEQGGRTIELATADLPRDRVFPWA